MRLGEQSGGLSTGGEVEVEGGLGLEVEEERVERVWWRGDGRRRVRY